MISFSFFLFLAYVIGYVCVTKALDGLKVTKYSGVNYAIDEYLIPFEQNDAQERFVNVAVSLCSDDYRNTHEEDNQDEFQGELVVKTNLGDFGMSFWKLKNESFAHNRWLHGKQSCRMHMI